MSGEGHKHESDDVVAGNVIALSMTCFRTNFFFASGLDFLFFGIHLVTIESACFKFVTRCVIGCR